MGVTVDPKQMLLFIQATEEVGAKVKLSHHMKDSGDESISREETIINLTKCISDWWKKNCKNCGVFCGSCLSFRSNFQVRNVLNNQKFKNFYSKKN